MLTVKQAAERLKISKQSVNNYMKRNNLTYHKDELTNMNYIDSNQFDILHQSVATNNQQTATNNDNDATTDASEDTTANDSATVNRLLDIIAEQQQTIDKLSTKQSQALINAQVIQREQLGTDTTDGTDTGATDSDSGTVTHRHTDTTEDAQRSHNGHTNKPEDNGKHVDSDEDSGKPKGKGWFDKLLGR